MLYRDEFKRKAASLSSAADNDVATHSAKKTLNIVIKRIMPYHTYFYLELYLSLNFFFIN